MKFRKYEFTPAKWAELKVDLQSSKTESGESEIFYNREIVNSVVEIGHLIISRNEEEVVLSDKFSVDILWQVDELPSFASYKIWCTPVGIHSFGASIDADYEQAYLKQLAN
jgi:hypothetical protein